MNRPIPNIPSQEIKEDIHFLDFINTIIADMPGYIYYRGQKNLNYLGCNQLFAALFDLETPSAIIGKSEDDLLVRKNFASSLSKNDYYVFNTKKSISETYELPPKTIGGETTWIKLQVSPFHVGNECIGVIGIACNITEEQLKYHAADQKKQFVEDIIYNLPGFIYWKNKNSQYVGFNRNVVLLSGLDKKELMGKKDTETNWGKREAESFMQDDQEIIKTGVTKITEHEIPIRRPDGQFMVVKTEKSRLVNRDGSVFGVLAVAIDITEQIRVKDQLTLEKERSDQANLIKTEFMRNMEHDIRTPFNGIWGMANFLYEQETDPVKKECLGDITKCSKELFNYCNDILDFSNIESEKTALVHRKFDIKELIDSLIKTELPAATVKKLELNHQCEDQMPKWVIGDRYRIYRILMNLLSNAIKFTETGSVTLKTSLVRKEAYKILVRFIVQDTGIGIPDEKQDYIFEKFSRLSLSNKGLYKGLGIGLRTVKKFMQELGGEIDLISNVGKGTKFICLIPLDLPLDTKFN